MLLEIQDTLRQPPKAERTMSRVSLPGLRGMCRLPSVLHSLWSLVEPRLAVAGGHIMTATGRSLTKVASLTASH